jgi:hypothetical protein
VGDHSIAGVGLRQRPDRIAGAAELERAAALQRFGLEMQLAAGQRVQRARTQHRGDVGVGCDARGGGQDIVEGRQGQEHRKRLTHATLFAGCLDP